MVFELKRLGRQKVRANSLNEDLALKYQLVLDGVKTTPTRGEITIWAPGESTTPLVDADAMNVSSTVLSFNPDTCTTPTNWPVGRGYRADVVVTVSTTDYVRHVMFDVVNYILALDITKDSLISLDDGLVGMKHIDDEAFAALIESVRDIIQMKIETKVVEDEKLIENALVDSSQIATVGRFLILKHLWANKGDVVRRDFYDTEYENAMISVLSSMKYDIGQTGFEGNKIGCLQQVRLVP